MGGELHAVTQRIRKQADAGNTTDCYVGIPSVLAQFAIEHGLAIRHLIIAVHDVVDAGSVSHGRGARVGSDSVRHIGNDSSRRHTLYHNHANVVKVSPVAVVLHDHAALHADKHDIATARVGRYPFVQAAEAIGSTST